LLEGIGINRETTVRLSVRNMKDLIASCYIEFSLYCIVFTTLLKHNNVNNLKKVSINDIKKRLKIPKD
jgi:hypothetical protein